MKALSCECWRNLTGYFLTVLSIACVVYGHHAADATLVEIGKGLLPTAMLALHIQTNSPADPAKSPN